MRVELLCNESKYPDILRCIFEASEKRLDQICAPSGMIPRIDEIFIREHCNFSALNACKENGLTIRPIIEYRIADDEFLYELCSSLKYNGATEIVVGTGSMVDDILDNIISSKLIEDKLNLPVVSCSPILSQEHYDIFYDSNIHGIRLKSYKILDNLCTIW